MGIAKDSTDGFKFFSMAVETAVISLLETIESELPYNTSDDHWNKVLPYNYLLIQNTGAIISAFHLHWTDANEKMSPADIMYNRFSDISLGNYLEKFADIQIDYQNKISKDSVLHRALKDTYAPGYRIDSIKSILRSWIWGLI